MLLPESISAFIGVAGGKPSPRRGRVLHIESTIAVVAWLSSGAGQAMLLAGGWMKPTRFQPASKVSLRCAMSDTNRFKARHGCRNGIA